MDDNNYDIINGKKYKKCNDNQIRNPITRRCINKEKKIAKELLLLKDKYNPRYLLKYVKIREKKIYKSTLPLDDYTKRLYIYKKINEKIDKKIILGENIIIKNKINYSINGNMYLSYLKKNPKFEFISKIILDNKRAEKEILYLKMVSDAVINNRCPHFPILYGNYDLILNDEDLKIIPKLLRVDNNNNFKIILNEYAEGNLKIFLTKMNKSDKLYLNALTQIFLSLILFYKETNSFHNNSIWDNFVYKNVNIGGYYHYLIMGKNYYLENLGYLWIISEYDKCVDFKKSRDKNIMIKNDFEKIIYSFLPSHYNGLIKDNLYKISEKYVVEILKILNMVKYYSELYSISGMKIFITKIMNLLVKIDLIKTSVNPSLIINKIPYKYI